MRSSGIFDGLASLGLSILEEQGGGCPMSGELSPWGVPVAAPQGDRGRGLEILGRLAFPELGILLAIAVLFVGAAVSTDGFASGANVSAILLSASITGIAAVAMTPIVLSGHYVSIAASASGALGAVAFVAALGAGWGAPLAIAATVALLLVIGILQGLVVSAGLNPILTTLAAASVITGALASITGGINVTVGAHAPSWGGADILGLQLSVYVFLAVTVLAAVAMRKTVLGRQVILFGANRETALLNGISAVRVALVVFAVFSIGVALAGILWGGQLGVAGVGTLPDLTVNSIAAVLIGGNAIQGGSGSPLRSAGGAILIAEATNIMLLNQASNGVQQAVVGAVVLVVVLTLQILARRSGR
jgi:ribose transport system permease protein